MMSLLINELVKVNLIPLAAETALREKLSLQKLANLESVTDSAITRVYSCYGCIDDISLSLSQVLIGYDVPSVGARDVML